MTDSSRPTAPASSAALPAAPPPSAAATPAPAPAPSPHRLVRGAVADNSNFVDNIALSLKLSILVLLLALPVGILLYLLVVEKNIAIDFGKKEIYGVRYTRPLKTLLEMSTRHGWMTSGTKTANQLAAAIAPALEELKKVDGELGSIMQVRQEIQAAQREFATLPAAGFSTGPETAARRLIARVNDVSNLILDPDLDSYYLMDATMLVFPDQIVTAGELGRRAIWSVQTGSMSAEDRAQLTVRVGALRLAIERLRRGYDVAYQNNPAGTLDGTLRSVVNRYFDKTEAFCRLAESLADGDSSGQDAELLSMAADEALTAMGTAWSVSFDHLDRLLNVRIDGFERRKVAALTGSITAFLLAVLVAFGISRRLNSRVGRLGAVAHRIADEADIDDEVEANLAALASKDEIGDLASTMRTMATRLRESIEHIQRQSHELERANEDLERRVHERTAELRSKNDELGATLDQLERTKDQLIVQEKMASLGNLTAGIAHEIKNPLNFVNNFAELSVELAHEIREVLDGQRDKLDAAAYDDLAMILDDLEQNVGKINEHGKRADSIVKGMLQHSRGNTGEMTKVDVNHLLEEYVNLAYHGMRAQDSSFNVTIEKDIDETIPDITCVPQDLSRVFLNIVNNGCYAADQKRRSGVAGAAFMPTISVATKLLDPNRVEVRIRDNGTGMPEHIRAKIFEPFFTTKPTGVGTGLGLSLSYDIVVQQHGGNLEVHTVDGEGTEFVIQLPVSQEKRLS